MRYEILFNAEIFRKQMVLNSRRMYRRKRVFSTINLIVGLLLSSQIFHSFSGSTVLNYGIGFFLVLNAVIYFAADIRRSFAIKKLINDHIYKNIPSGIFSWEFTITHLNYKEAQMETIVEWQLFQSFEILGDTLFLLSNVYVNPFVLSEEEIGTEDFKTIISFLNGKVKPGKSVAKYLLHN